MKFPILSETQLLTLQVLVKAPRALNANQISKNVTKARNSVRNGLNGLASWRLVRSETDQFDLEWFEITEAGYDVTRCYGKAIETWERLVEERKEA